MTLRKRVASPLFLPLLFLWSLATAVLSKTPHGKIADTFAEYEQVEEINRSLNPVLNDILHNTDFFGYYRLNLYQAQCPVSWGDAFPLCGNRACAVDTLNEEDIPEVWRATNLGKVTGPVTTHPDEFGTSHRPRKTIESAPLAITEDESSADKCIFENGYDAERDYCIPDDESATSEGVYVSLVNNPERFTGYAGDHANAVWKEIYRENCFEMQPQTYEEEIFLSRSQAGQGTAKIDLEAVMLGMKGKRVSAMETETYNQLQLENSCLEKRVFWRLISGMHTSISTHLSWEYLNQTTGQWAPNLDVFKSRVWNHPQWIENLYFNYVVVLRAITKLSTYLDSYSYCSDDPTKDTLTQQKVHSLITTAQIAAPSFDESRMFDPKDPTILGLKNEFRERFRNVSRIMDCVGCDKCRLWGKLQTSGYGTALKVLFEYDPEKAEDFHLRRTEVVSLIITLQRLSHSIWAVEQFREMALHPTLPRLAVEERIVEFVSNVELNSSGDAVDEMTEVVEPVKSVWSYALLPVSLWRMGMSLMGRLWDRCIIEEIGKARLRF